MADALITTVIPTFRRPALLRRAIESVLAQSFGLLTISVWDNASEDETEAVVAEYTRLDHRVRYFRNNTNIGGVNNMIQGVSSVTTEFYSILNDDDFLLPEFYKEAISQFGLHPQAGFVCAKAIVVDTQRNRMQFRNKEWRPGLYEPSIESVKKMHASHFTQTGVLMRRDMRTLIGSFESSGDDALYLTMAAAAAAFVVLDSYGAVFTLHPESYSATVGLRNESMPAVCAALLSTVKTIIALEMPEERKAHLLLLALNSYGATLDIRRLNALMRKNEKDDVVALIVPSRVTSHGVLEALYSKVPAPLRPLVNTARRLRNVLGARRMRSDWVPLSREAADVLKEGERSAERFVAACRDTKRWPYKIGQSDK